MTAWRCGHPGPGELEEQEAGRSGGATGLIACPVPILGWCEEVPGTAGGPLKLRMIEELPQGPVLADRVVAREPQPRAWTHHPGQLVERVWLHESPLRVPALGPGVREQEEHAADRRGSQCVEEQTGVVCQDPGPRAVLDREMGKQCGDATDKGLTPQKPGVRVGTGQGGQVLATPETDFQPGFGHGSRKQGSGLERASRPVNRDRELGEDVLDQGLPAGSQAAELPPSVTAIARPFS